MPPALELNVLRLAAGRSSGRRLERQQDLLYVAVGMGALRLDGEEHPLEPDTAALVLPGETYETEAESDLVVVRVSAPAAEGLARSRVTMQLEECEERRADEHRTFRVLFETDVTQFVGFVQPSRASDHSHPYDEVGYILEGEGFAHVEGASTPIRPGSEFRLPRGRVHCIENSGPGVMRILGVFWPAGSPAQRS